LHRPRDCNKGNRPLAPEELVYDANVADQRNPTGRRPPILPLPAPPEADDTNTAQRARPRARPPTKDVTSELPRLPQVSLHADPGEVRVDGRSLSPARGSLNTARPAAGRSARPTAPEKPRTQPPSRGQPPTAPQRPRGMPEPQPPPRSAQVRV